MFCLEEIRFSVSTSHWIDLEFWNFVILTLYVKLEMSDFCSDSFMDVHRQILSSCSSYFSSTVEYKYRLSIYNVPEWILWYNYLNNYTYLLF